MAVLKNKRSEAGSTNSGKLNFTSSRNALLLVAGLIFSVGCSQSPTAGIEADGSGIIGGQEVAKIDENVYTNTVVSLFNIKDQSLCTASIIAPDLLLTAAHCLSGPAVNMRIIFGPRLVEPIPENTVIRPVDSYVTSPFWAIRQFERQDNGDIAIVKFSGGLPEGYKVVPILDDWSILGVGSKVVLAGYGWSDGINKTGSGILRFVETEIESTDFSSTEIVFNQKNGKGACHGDSGGPAYVKVGEQWALIGVTSRGINDPQDTCGVSSVYTLAPAYKKWIQTAGDELRRSANSRSAADSQLEDVFEL